MKARLVVEGEPKRAARLGLRALEWFFLLFGLIAIDCYVWINTTTVLYQAYEDWAFDQALRGLTPSVPGFIGDEWRWLRGEKPTPAPEAVKTLPKYEPIPEAKPPLPSSLIGRLEIPRLHLSVMVREGADNRTLRQAVGHIPGTALPSRLGNVGLAGHRDTFFRRLRGVRPGDTIVLTTLNGSYEYQVQSCEVVTPRDTRVLANSAEPALTLVTCYPFHYLGPAPERFIVHASRSRS